jgi:hypothetical protein
LKEWGSLQTFSSFCGMCVDFRNSPPNQVVFLSRPHSSPFARPGATS